MLVVSDVLTSQLPSWLTPIPSFYGMHIAAVARASVDLDRVTEALLRQNLKIHTLSRYYLEAQSRPGLIFGYGAPDLPEIQRGLTLLRKAFLRE